MDERKAISITLPEGLINELTERSNREYGPRRLSYYISDLLERAINPAACEQAMGSSPDPVSSTLIEEKIVEMESRIENRILSKVEGMLQAPKKTAPVNLDTFTAQKEDIPEVMTEEQAAPICVEPETPLETINQSESAILGPKDNMPAESVDEIIKRLDNYLLKTGMKQKEFTDKFGIDLSNLSKWRKHLKNMTFATWEKLRNAVNTAEQSETTS